MRVGDLHKGIIWGVVEDIQVFYEGSHKKKGWETLIYMHISMFSERKCK